MRAISKVSIRILTAASSVLLGAVAHADAPALFAQGGSASITVYHGNAAQGAVVGYPELHWTSRIGTGTAAAFAQRGKASKTVHDGVHVHGTSVRYPQAHWTSRIGTGTAAAFED